MKTINHSLEALFLSLARLSCRFPWLVLLFCVGLTISLASQLPKLTLDATAEAVLPEDAPETRAFEALKRDFGRNDDIILSITTDEVFTPAFLTDLIALHQALESTLPHVSAVNSLHSARNIYGTEEDLVIEALVESVPLTPETMADMRHKAVTHPFYRNAYITEDGKTTNLTITPATYYLATDPLTGAESQALVGDFQLRQVIEVTEQVLGQFPAFDGKINISGLPIVNDELVFYMSRDLATFISLSLLLVAVALGLIFRNTIGVILPLLVVISALVATMGLIGATVRAIQMPTVILPSFILAVGVGDAVHVLTLYFRQLAKGNSKEQAVQSAVAHAGTPMFYTTITTALGLCSFLLTDLVPIANLGLYSAVGIVFALIYSLLMLPALLIICPKPKKVASGAIDTDSNPLISHVLTGCVNLSSRFPEIIIAAGIGLLIASLFIASGLTFSHDPVRWLPDNSKARESVAFVEERLGGAVPIDIVIDAGEPDGMKDPALIASIESLTAALNAYATDNINTARVLSISDLVKETNQALFDNAASEYRIPDDRNLLAQEYMMLETGGANDLFKLVDSHYRKAHITVFTPWVDSLAFIPYINGVEQLAQKHIGDQATIQMTGPVAIFTRILYQVMDTTAWSYILAFSVVSLMMLLLLSDLRLALVSMVPNLLPVVFTLAMMRLTNTPLDMFSMLIGSIAIGLAVDDTIHFMHGFKRQFERTGDAYLAVENTLHSTGRAMLTTTLVLSCGFLIYLASPMNNLNAFGVFTALCIVVALVADLLFAPACMIYLHRKRLAKTQVHAN